MTGPLSFLNQPIPAVFVPQRSLKSDHFDMVADVTVEELHEHNLVITRHPVEQGAQITDHAYKEPVYLRLYLGWSNSNPQAGFDLNYVTDIFEQLRNMQISRELVTVITGKATYPNLLIASIREVTDQKTEYALMIQMDLQEVILVDTTTTQLPQDRQASPQDTSGTQRLGTLQGQQVGSLDTILGPFD